MAHARRRLQCVALVACAAALVAAPAAAEEKKAPKAPKDTYEAAYARYLDSARQTAALAATPVRSSSWMTDLAFDPRARRVNDLVTVRVVESIVAQGTADSQLSKNSKGSASVTNLFGLEDKFPDWLDPTNLARTSSDTDFKGGGTTTRSGELVSTMTARVVEVLPNGDLVLEGAREIDINGDRQILVLTGVARPQDIDRANRVLSTSVGQLRIQYYGRGLIKDNLRPGWLIRVLNKIF